MSKKYNVFQAISLKEDYLLTKLKLMGIKNPFDIEGEINISSGYHVLGRIGNSLESFVNPLKVASSRKEDSDEKLDKFVNEIEEDKIFMENQDELILRIRSIYPEFAKHPEDKISGEDLSHYIKTVRATARLVRDLTVGSSKRDFTELSELEAQDKISELIDSQDFARACDIEDAFMAEEFEDFKRAAKELEYEDEDIKNTTVCVNLAELVRETENIGNKKQRYRSNFKKYQKFVKSLKDRVIIKSADLSGKKGDRDDR